MIDVGQGDCTVITLPFHQGVIMIDAMGSLYKDIPKDIILPVLQKRGIHKIDALIVTHEDYDHSGGVEELAKLIPIHKIITEKQKDIDVSGVPFHFLIQDYIGKNANENSIITYFEMYDVGYLFMGDAGYGAEAAILKEYADLKVDEPPLFKNDSVQQLSFEDINRNGTITPVKRRDPDSFNFDGICPYCGDKAKDFISIVENKIKSNKLSSIDETINYLILHQSDEIANLETISTKTFYNYVHQGRTSIKPIDLPRMVRKKTKKNWKTYIPKRKKELPLQKDQIISMKEVNLVIGKVIWLLVPEMDKMELILLY